MRSRATGIELADGRKITATKAVIAGTSPKGLRKIGDTAPAFDKAMDGFRHAPGTMMIHLAMDGLPDWRAGEQLKRFALCPPCPQP